jgi:hypothetical protein
MKITITQCCGIEGQVAEPNETVSVSDAIGKQLIAMGKAVPFVPKAKEAEKGKA